MMGLVVVTLDACALLLVQRGLNIRGVKREAGVDALDLLAGGVLQMDPAALLKRVDLGEVVVHCQKDFFHCKNLPFRSPWVNTALLPSRRNVMLLAAWTAYRARPIRAASRSVCSCTMR